MDLADLTTLEAADHPAGTLLVPLGATEQHGPHLPLSTDTDIAGAWCRALADRIGDALVAPALPYGSSGEHQHFDGTLSIGQVALEAVLVELARSATERFERVVFVSGHAGNAAPLTRAVTTLRSEGRNVVSLLPHLAGADAHAGHTETSLMLHLRPDRVRLERAEAGCTEPISAILDEMVAGGVIAVAPNGVLGDPTGASPADGERVLAELVDLGWSQLMP